MNNRVERYPLTTVDRFACARLVARARSARTATRIVFSVRRQRLAAYSRIGMLEAGMGNESRARETVNGSRRVTENGVVNKLLKLRDASLRKLKWR